MRRLINAIDWRYYSAAYDDSRRSRNTLAQNLFGAVAPAGIAFACAWMLGALFVGSDAEPIPRLPPIPEAARDAAIHAAKHAAIDAAKTAVVDFFEARFSSAFPPGTYLKTSRLQSDDEPEGSAAQGAIEIPQDVAPTLPQAERPAQSRPAPARAAEPRARPSRSASRRDRTQRNSVVASAPAEEPSIFEKLFGKLSPSKLALAYAAPEDGASDQGQAVTAGRYDRSTAVYDISAHTVYMPNGTKLEAHSGLGSLIDDPRHVHERNRGSTPPNVYDLQLREAPFHGVRAIRLIPVDEEKVFGRSGLLAHTYMLGPDGDSNGCVSFKNYDAFLQAYLNQEVKRLVVVARLD